MSISIGGIDIPNAIINIEYELVRTQRILDWLIANNQTTLRLPTKDVIAQIDDQAIEVLQKKYPEAGIAKK